MSTTVFALVWVALIAAAILLDWIGNPQRGRFRPAGDRAKTRSQREEIRHRREAEQDARDRAALAEAAARRERRRRPRPGDAAPVTEDDAMTVRKVLDGLPPTGQDRRHGTASTDPTSTVPDADAGRTG